MLQQETGHVGSLQDALLQPQTCSMFNLTVKASQEGISAPMEPLQVLHPSPKTKHTTRTVKTTCKASSQGGCWDNSPPRTGNQLMI